MSIPVAEKELHRSCRVLFGDGLDVNQFLNYLRHSGLKKAYRLKARQSHPDLVATDPARFAGNCADDFIAVQQAYENLRCFLDHRDQGYRFQFCTSTNQSNPPNRSTPWKHAPQQEHSCTRPGAGRGATGSGSPYTQLYRGPIPQFRMKFGNFLYYSGLVDRITIVKALIWQRSQRPRLGELAKSLGWLTEEAIRETLADRQFMEQFGTSAVRRRYLTEKQLNILLGYQKLLQKKLGAFFVDQRILTHVHLEELALQHHKHNTSCIDLWSS